MPAPKSIPLLTHLQQHLQRLRTKLPLSALILIPPHEQQVLQDLMLQPGLRPRVFQEFQGIGDFLGTVRGCRVLGEREAQARNERVAGGLCEVNSAEGGTENGAVGVEDLLVGHGEVGERM